MQNSQNSNILYEIENIAREAGEEIMRIYNTDFGVEVKEDKTPLTLADTRSNEITTSRLKEFGLPVLSEEEKDNSERLESERVWVVDPMDGTSDFVDRTGEFCIMIGLVDNGAPVAGLVYLPAVDHMYMAEKGKGAFLKSGEEIQKLGVSGKSDSRESKIVVSRSHFADNVRHLYEALGINDIVRVGSNGLKKGMIARGEAELFFNPTSKMGEWDLCAPQVIVEEAGGRVTNALGEELVYNKKEPNTPNGVLASNTHLHDAAVEEAKRIIEE